MARTPAIAKRLGRKVRMRADWDEAKYDVMRSVVRAKFSDPEMARLLLATGDEELVEFNIWGDVVWGQCADSTWKWVGQNWLGKLLMELRIDLRRNAGHDH